MSSDTTYKRVQQFGAIGAAEHLVRDDRMPPRKNRVFNTNRFFERVNYDPHPGQLRLHSSNARFKTACCGRRWGKSKSGPHDKAPKVFLREPTRGWIVAPTYDLGEKEFRVFWDILVDKLKVPTVKGRTAYNPRTKDFLITTGWGAVIEVRSAEHPESLVGEGLDWVIMAEAAKLKLSHWEKYVRPSLADKRGEAIFVSTPEGYNWFYDMWQNGQSSDMPDWFSIQSPTWENTRIFPQGYSDPEIQDLLAQVKRGTLTEEVFNQEYGAQFTSFAGRVYSEFDEGYHVLQNYEFNPEWPNYLAFDFGFRNPWVCLQIQVDPNTDCIYIWDEYYERGMPTPDHARRLKSLIQWRVDGGYYDPSGADQIASVLKIFHDRREYHNRFLESASFEPGPNEWEMGVARVKQFLKIIDDGMGNSRPSLFVAKACTNTVKEFNSYRMREQSENVKERQDPKEEPRKKDDHAMDALRYFVAGHYGLEAHYGYQS